MHDLCAFFLFPFGSALEKTPETLWRFAWWVDMIKDQGAGKSHEDACPSLVRDGDFTPSLETRRPSHCNLRLTILWSILSRSIHIKDTQEHFMSQENAMAKTSSNSSSVQY